MVVEILVSVNRPVTNEGRISNVTPLPFEVEMFVSNTVSAVPLPPNLPSVPMTHAAGMALALKLPLDCAKASPDPNAAISADTAKTDANFLIKCFSPLLLVRVFHVLLHPGRGSRRNP